MANRDPGGRTAPLFLDDLQVGQRFVSDTHRIDPEQIRAFAVQFDPQPFHLDAEAAKATLFEGLVASGWHTAAISMRLLVESGLPIAGGLIGAGAELTWPSPTRPGDVLQAESEVLELRPSRSRPDRGMATIRSETRNQRGDTVQVLVAKFVVLEIILARIGNDTSISDLNGLRLGYYFFNPIGSIIILVGVAAAYRTANGSSSN